MFLSRIFRTKRILLSEFSVWGSRLTHQLIEVKDDPCQYPPILDVSDEGLKRIHRQMWYDSVKAMPSVEQKLHEIAVQQLMDLKTFTLSSVPSTYNAADFHSYITRTHFIRGLPKQLTDLSVDKELGEVKDSLYDVVLNFYCNCWNGSKKKMMHDLSTENDAGPTLANNLILQCYKKLGLKNDYIIDSTIQQNPRIYSFWWHGGYGKEEDEEHEKNLCFQFEDNASFCIRVKKPLLPILDLNHPLCSTSEVSDYHFHPNVFHTPSSSINKLASIPGFWPGDPCDFPFLLVENSAKLNSLTSKLEQYDINKIEDGCAVMSSFAWLNSLATYQGFTPFHDVTYPFVTHTILTNGQDWRFYVYQLNTVAFHNDVDNKNRRNICWSSGNLRLFDTIEDSKVKGVNNEVFEIILKFLHNAPHLSEDFALKPYLGEDTRSTEEKGHLRYFLRKMYSRAPLRMAHRDEVPTWVKIYKLHKDAPPSPFVRLE